MQIAPARTRAERRWLFLGLVAGLLVGPVTRAASHWLTPAEVLGELRAPAARETLGVVGAGRQSDLPRLLVIRVDQRWATALPEERRTAAERWRRHWREAVPQGIVAIVDAGSDRSLVSFDAAGRAMLKDQGPGPAGSLPGGADPEDRHRP